MKTSFAFVILLFCFSTLGRYVCRAGFIHTNYASKEGIEPETKHDTLTQNDLAHNPGPAIRKWDKKLDALSANQLYHEESDSSSKKQEMLNDDDSDIDAAFHTLFKTVMTHALKELDSKRSLEKPPSNDQDDLVENALKGAVTSILTRSLAGKRSVYWWDKLRSLSADTDAGEKTAGGWDKPRAMADLTDAAKRTTGWHNGLHGPAWADTAAAKRTTGWYNGLNYGPAWADTAAAKIIRSRANDPGLLENAVSAGLEAAASSAAHQAVAHVMGQGKRAASVWPGDNMMAGWGRSTADQRADASASLIGDDGWTKQSVLGPENTNIK